MRKNFKKAAFFMMLGLLSASSMSAQITIQAEKYSDKKDGKTEIVQEDYSGEETIGYFDEDGETLIYEVDVPTTGMYQFSAKFIARWDGDIRIQTDDGAYAVYTLKGNIEAADQWWNVNASKFWEYKFEDGPSFYLTAGKHTISVINEGASANIDYFAMQKSDVTDNKVVKIKTVPSKLEMMAKENLRIAPVGYNEAGQKIAMPIKWSSNVNDGTYTAQDYGKDKISITMGDFEKEFTINVAKPTKKKEFVVSKYGALSAKGFVADKNGEKVSLMGPSYFWSCSADLWWCKETVDFLVDQYNIQVLRLPVAIAPCGSNGQTSCQKSGDKIDTWNEENYLQKPEKVKKLVDGVIKACIENDIYVIIDFHEHKAQDWTDLAKDFFSYFASKWNEYPNIMYEIFNEPIDANSVVVDYAKKVIPAIREYDKNNIIIVGSTQYSREPHNVTDAGQGQTNIAYTWHGYAQYGHESDWNSHSDWNNGIPIVVTEWGYSDNGDGGMHSIFKKNGVINCFWSMSNQGGADATWSVLKSSCWKKSNWNESEMTYNGKSQLDQCKSWINFTPKVLEVETEEFVTSICAGSKIFLASDPNKATIYGEATGGSGNYTYSWEQTKGEKATIASANSAKTEVSGLKPGINVFALTISDGTETETMSVTITVYAEDYVDPGLIDDVADKDLVSRIGGKWIAFDDASDKGSSVPTVSADKGNIEVNCKMGNAIGNIPPYCGVDLYLDKNSTAESPVTFDLSNCSKITYRYKGSEHFFRLAMKGITDGNYHCSLVGSSNSWTEVSLSVSSLAQEDWGTKVSFDPKDVIKLSWMAKDGAGSTKTLEIDDVTCVGMEFPENMNNVGLTDATIINNMYLFPNPSENGECTLFVLERCNVVITDVAGAIVKEFVAVPDFNNEFSISKPGVYFVKAGNDIAKLIVK